MAQLNVNFTDVDEHDAEGGGAVIIPRGRYLLNITEGEVKRNSKNTGDLFNYKTEIHGTRIRLDGIDAPESAQLCRDTAGKSYRCGQRAALALADWIGQRVVTCWQSGNGRSYDRIVATCSVDGADMAAWLVSQGHALDWPRYSHGRYLTQQRDAVAAQRGMWSGNFVNPWYYRTCMRAGGGHIATCSDGAR